MGYGMVGEQETMLAQCSHLLRSEGDASRMLCKRFPCQLGEGEKE